MDIFCGLLTYDILPVMDRETRISLFLMIEEAARRSDGKPRGGEINKIRENPSVTIGEELILSRIETALWSDGLGIKNREVRSEVYGLLGKIKVTNSPKAGVRRVGQ
jgi:hypothetical protein